MLDEIYDDKLEESTVEMHNSNIENGMPVPDSSSLCSDSDMGVRERNKRKAKAGRKAK